MEGFSVIKYIYKFLVLFLHSFLVVFFYFVFLACVCDFIFLLQGRLCSCMLITEFRVAISIHDTPFVHCGVYGDKYVNISLIHRTNVFPLHRALKLHSLLLFFHMGFLKGGPLLLYCALSTLL